MRNSFNFTNINFEDILSKLSDERPIFHSEADFQFALAWELKNYHPTVDVRMEKKVEIENELIYLDIVLQYESEEFAIELKYKTKKTERIKHNNEFYELTNHAAHGNGRYDFLKDISRIEKYKRNGVAIFLTNDHLYWETSQNKTKTPDDNFRIHEGKGFHGEYNWLREQYTKERFVKIYTNKRYDSIKVVGNYTMNWKDYSNFDKNKFRYLIVKISAQI